MAFLPDQSANEIGTNHIRIADAVSNCSVEQTAKRADITGGFCADRYALFHNTAADINNVSAGSKAAEETALFYNRTGLDGYIDNIDCVRAARCIAAAGADIIISIITIIDSIITDQGKIF